MKRLNDQFIIGVDHGYGNIKTANHCFRTGILGYDSEPLFTGDMLTYGGRYYLIGEGHKEFIAEKIRDEDYYLLTLVAIAKELKDAELTEANIVLAAGLPYILFIFKNLWLFDLLFLSSGAASKTAQKSVVYSGQHGSLK